MNWKEAQERAIFFDFVINITNGDKTWFSAMKHWDYTGQSFALEVKPEENKFKLTKMVGMVIITTDWCGSFDDDVHFLKIQRVFMETIEKLKPAPKRCWNCDGKGVGLDYGAMNFWNCETCKGTGELE